MFKKIALALAFSPYAESLLTEAVKLKSLFQAELTIIHISERDERESAKEKIDQLLHKINAPLNKIQVLIQTGSPAQKILSACKKNRVDLLICGALQKEGLIRYYVGSVSRTILRKAPCSVFVALAATKPTNFKKMVVDCNDENRIRKTLETAFYLGHINTASHIYLVRELRLYGLTMAMEEYKEEEYGEVKKAHLDRSIREVEKMLEGVETYGLKATIKVTGGKPGFELARMIKTSGADLLVASAPSHRLGFINRVFPHHLEYLFADLPCDFLLVHS